MFDLSACRVERTEDQHYLIHWRTSRPGQRVAVYISDCREHFYSAADAGAPILYSTDDTVVVHNPDAGVRHYFRLESESGDSVILAERRLNLAGTPNFRDLGGYQTEDGRRLRWGKLFRSSKLSALTDEDIGYVNRLGVTTICDFRQLVEQELEPSWLGDASESELASLPVAPGSRGSFIENLHNGVIAVHDPAGFMEEINRDFVANQMPQYAEMFKLLLVGDQQFLIHCASGKDRTGFGAALILDVLGVDEEAIVEDYLLTNTFLPVDEEVKKLSSEFTDHSGAALSEDVLRPMVEVRPEYIRACFDEIKRRFQSKEHFFESALDLDEDRVEKLRDQYLH